LAPDSGFEAEPLSSFFPPPSLLQAPASSARERTTAIPERFAIRNGLNPPMEWAVRPVYEGDPVNWRLSGATRRTC